MTGSPWPLKRFGDLYRVASRNGLTRPSAERGAGYKMINMGELFAYPRLFDPPMERVKLSEAEKEKFDVRPLDLLFARQSLVAEGAGKCCIAVKTEPYTTFESHLIRVRLDLQQCDPLFYFYFFRSGTGFSFIQTLVNQVSAAGIRGSELANLKVLYPPRNAQRKIAAILSAYDELIETNRRRIALLENMAEEIYREWFVRLRFPGYEIVKVVKGVPRGWQVLPFSQLVNINPLERVDKSEEIPFVGMEELSLNSMFFAPKETRKGGQGAKFRNRDVIFPRITPSVENGKRGFVMTLADGQVGFGSTEFIVMREKVIGPEHIYFLTCSSDFRKHAELSMTGASGRQRVQEECFSFFLVKTPPPEIRRQFSEIVQPHFSQIHLLSRQIGHLTKTRDLLLLRLISGKLSVENLDIQFPPGMVEELNAEPTATAHA